MRNRVPSLVLLLAVVGHAALAQSQEAPVAPAPPPVPQYQVEILIFANSEFDPSEERFSQELPAPPGGEGETLREAPVFDASNFGPLATAPDATAALPDSTTTLADSPTAAPTDDTEFRFRLLRAEELQLGAEYRRLENLAAYRPLLHAGWIQPGLPEAQSRPLDLAVLGALNPRGSVRVHLSRFLHVTLDLTYQDSLSGASEVSPAFGNEPSELIIAPRYRLATQRQTRSGELHYFDHPAFGVLVRVTPVPTEGTTPLPGRRPAA